MGKNMTLTDCMNKNNRFGDRRVSVFVHASSAQSLQYCLSRFCVDSLVRIVERANNDCC